MFLSDACYANLVTVATTGLRHTTPLGRNDARRRVGSSRNACRARPKGRNVWCSASRCLYP